MRAMLQLNGTPCWVNIPAFKRNSTALRRSGAEEGLEGRVRHGSSLDHPVPAAAGNESLAWPSGLLQLSKAMVDEAARRTCPRTPIKRKAETTHPGLKIPAFSFQC